MSIDLFVELDRNITETKALLEYYETIKTKIKRKQITLAVRQIYDFRLNRLCIYVYHCVKGKACASIYSQRIDVAYEDSGEEFDKFVEELKSVYPKVKVLNY